MGFALLARHFEESAIPDQMPAVLPDGRKGGAMLLGIVFLLSSFLDNIAGAIIGGTVARHVFRGEVHMGYLAAIVAASNAGGAGSVVGDTTTTMMWVAGISPLNLIQAYVGAIVAFLIFAVPASLQQERHSPIKSVPSCTAWPRSGARVVGLGNGFRNHAVTGARLEGSARDGQRRDFSHRACYRSFNDARRAATSGIMADGARFRILSAIFDNTPLTALALKQGGYDWDYLAYTVGLGGSMIWFGSSAGVAVSNQYPQTKSVALWLRHGWYISVAYVAGFFAMLILIGWHPDPPLGNSGIPSH
jgi:hypothetical protein